MRLNLALAQINTRLGDIGFSLRILRCNLV